jgi:hypothetical protein
LNRWISSAWRPRVETISPWFRNASEIAIDWSSRPPGLLRRSITQPCTLSAPISSVSLSIALFMPSNVCSLNDEMRM